MTEKTTYPQIPSTVWWGVRKILITKPNVQLTEKTLAFQLGVQEAAAKAYLKELQKVGILNEENKPTELANEWRLDSSYPKAIPKILKMAYPLDLLNSIDANQTDKKQVKEWFLLEGLGSGSAGNKAATLALLASPVPIEANNTTKTTPQKQNNSSDKIKEPKQKDKGSKLDRPPSGQNLMPLNINLQIHISADSTNEQIDKIFKSMKEHLYSSNDN